MKKYLTFAAILGAIAFLSVSYLAQAESEAVKEMTTTTITTTTTTETPAAPAVEGQIDLAKISEECKTEAAADKADGTKKTEEETTAAFNDCLKMKTGSAMQQDVAPTDGAVVKEGEAVQTPAE